MTDNYRLEIELATDLSEALNTLERVMDECRKKWKLSDRDHFQIRMVLDELVSNTINYGFSSGRGGTIKIIFELTPDRVCKIVYTDDAPEFDSVSQTVPKEMVSTEAMGFGGLGLSLIKKMMDRVEYRRDNEKNTLYLDKKVD